MKKFKSLLYPVARSGFSAGVAPNVAALAWQLDASVHLLHVLRPFDWFVDI